MNVTVGFFDGVHLGHRRVLRRLLETSAGDKAAVVTFWPHPRAVLQQDARDLRLLNTFDEKVNIIRSAGVEDIRCVQFTKELSSLPAKEFIRDYLVGEMGCTRLVLGFDNRFGSDGLQTDQISLLAAEMGIGTEIVPPCVIDGLNVSSTRIRNAILDGDIELASKMLGCRYSIDGMVVPGNRMGREIGFPTANIALSFPLRAVPCNGVYAVEVIVNGKRYRGMTNIGVRPTIGAGAERHIETNIFDFNEDIYGLQIQLNFIARVRDEKKFDSVSALKNQLEIDRHRCYGYN